MASWQRLSHRLTFPTGGLPNLAHPLGPRLRTGQGLNVNGTEPGTLAMLPTAATGLAEPISRTAGVTTTGQDERHRGVLSIWCPPPPPGPARILYCLTFLSRCVIVTHVWPWRKTRIAAPRLEREQGQDAATSAERLNRLETRVERLELDNAERQVAVLSSLEKVLNQLRARERKRERDADEVDPTESAEDRGVARVDRGRHPRPAGIPQGSSTAHLSRRFKLGG